MFKKKRYRPPARPRNYRPDFRRYEIEKQAWIAHHPLSTGADYINAMREIAERCGI